MSGEPHDGSAVAEILVLLRREVLAVDDEGSLRFFRGGEPTRVAQIAQVTVGTEGVDNPEGKGTCGEDAGQDGAGEAGNTCAADILLNGHG